MPEQSPDGTLAVSMLRADHAQIDSLLGRLKQAAQGEQPGVLADLFLGLRIHSNIDQQLFYPSISGIMGEHYVSECGKDCYTMLTLMLEMESHSRSHEPINGTLQLLSEKFKQHIRTDEALFGQIENLGAEDKTQLAITAQKMAVRQAELKEKLTKNPFPYTGTTYNTFRPDQRQPRCA